MATQMSEKELKMIDSKGALLPCDHCGCKTYDGSATDQYMGHAMLPEGITTANRRKYLNVMGRHLTLCTKCRYDVYGGY